jgi:hypothetical protein
MEGLSTPLTLGAFMNGLGSWKVGPREGKLEGGVLIGKLQNSLAVRASCGMGVSRQRLKQVGIPKVVPKVCDAHL